MSAPDEPDNAGEDTLADDGEATESGAEPSEDAKANAAAKAAAEENTTDDATEGDFLPPATEEESEEEAAPTDDTSWLEGEDYAPNLIRAEDATEAAGSYSPRSLLQTVLPGIGFPEVAYNFIVSVGADVMGDFQSVEGIGYQIQPFSFNEGGRNHSPHLLPFRAPAEPQVATLRWGTVTWNSLYDWIKAVEVGKNFRRSVWIIQLGRSGWPTRITRLGSAWPVEWSGTRLSTQDSTWALEELKIAYEEINMVLTRVSDFT